MHAPGLCRGSLFRRLGPSTFGNSVEHYRVKGKAGDEIKSGGVVDRNNPWVKSHTPKEPAAFL